MATQTWTSQLLHDSDANFRVWGKKVSDELQAMSGLTKTSDTGQINWTTVTRPGTNNDAGYEVYYLNDSLHSTAPIYFRLDYGTATSATRPRLKLTVGTGSNGSGTITGTALTAANIISSSGGPSASSLTSYLCVTAGFIGFAGWCGGGASGVAQMGFIICRSCDTAGDPDTTGAIVMGHPAAASTTSVGKVQCLRFASTAAAYSLAASLGATCIIPHGESTTAISGDPQAYLSWMHTPYMQPVFGVCSVLLSEVSEVATFTATLVGQSRTYINMGSEIGHTVFVQGTGSTVNTWGLCMLWE